MSNMLGRDLLFYAITLGVIHAADIVPPMYGFSSGNLSANCQSTFWGYCWRPHVLCHGNDRYRSFNTPTGEFNETFRCMEACDRDCRCKSFNFDVESKECTLVARACKDSELLRIGEDLFHNFLRRGPGEDCRALNNCDLVPYKYCKRQNVRCYVHGPILEYVVVGSQNECEVNCSNNCGCKAFDYNTASKACSIHSSVCDPNHLTSTIGIDYNVRIGSEQNCDVNNCGGLPYTYCLRAKKGCCGSLLKGCSILPELKDCQEACNKDCNCKSIYYNSCGGQCCLKTRACRNEELKSRAGDDMVRIGPGENCDSFT